MTRATIRTRLDRPDVVAASVAPDNTPEMDTRVEGDCVVTMIERETTGGLQSTVDDYVVNLSVATRTAALGEEETDRPTDHSTNRPENQPTNEPTPTEDRNQS